MDVHKLRYRVASADGERERAVILAEGLDRLLELAEHPSLVTTPHVRDMAMKRRKLATPEQLQTRHLESVDVRQVFEHWVKVMQKHGNVRLTPERRKKIQARLKDGYTVTEIKRAIDGCSRSDFHMARGNHRGGRRYDDLTLILRNGTMLEGFRDNAGGEGTTDLKAFL